MSGHDLDALPEHCPYTLGAILGEAVPSAARQGIGGPGDATSDAATIISHVTPAGGNIFLDLGFPPDEAERLKAESDQRIVQKAGRESQEMPTDVDSGNVSLRQRAIARLRAAPASFFSRQERDSLASYEVPVVSGDPSPMFQTIGR